MNIRKYRLSSMLKLSALAVAMTVFSCMKPGDGVGLDATGKPLPPKPAFSYASPVFDTTADSVSHAPISTGGVITSYSATVLPAGLAIDANTGVISGSPTTPAAATDFSIQATGLGGAASAIINITIVDRCSLTPNPCIAAPNVTYGGPKQDTTGKVSTHAPNISAGGAVTSYAMLAGSTLPAGLSLDPVTGVISGTATTVTAAANYSVVATGPGGSYTAVINIVVVPPLSANFYTTRIQAIFTSACISCHSPTGVGYAQTGGASGGLDLTGSASYDLLVNNPAFEFTAPEQMMRVLPGKSDSSYLYLKVSGVPTVGNLVPNTRMPLNTTPLTATQIGFIKQWIDAGAPRN